MSSDEEHLAIEPSELRFQFELNKQISCSLRLANKTDEHVAFKVKTTNPKKYSVRPNSGVVMPQSTCDVVVTMQAQKGTPVDLQCKDKFLIQSIVVDSSTTSKDIIAEMFAKESGNIVEERKLRVVYLWPQQQPRPDLGEAKEGYSHGPLLAENNGASTSSDLGSPISSEAPINPSEINATYSRAFQETNSAIQQKDDLNQVEPKQREVRKQHSHVSLVLAIVIIVLGVLVGYLAKK